MDLADRDPFDEDKVHWKAAQSRDWKAQWPGSRRHRLVLLQRPPGTKKDALKRLTVTVVNVLRDLPPLRRLQTISPREEHSVDVQPR